MKTLKNIVFYFCTLLLFVGLFHQNPLKAVENGPDKTYPRPLGVSHLPALDFHENLSVDRKSKQKERGQLELAAGNSDVEIEDSQKRSRIKEIKSGVEEYRCPIILFGLIMGSFTIGAIWYTNLDMDPAGLCKVPNATISVERLAEHIFDEARILNINVQMKQTDWRKLKLEYSLAASDQSFGSAFLPSFSWYDAATNIDGYEAEKMEIRKKSWYGSFSTTKPGLKLKNTIYDPDVRDDFRTNPMAKVSKFTLNNSVQDISYLKQCVAYKILRNVGIEAPYCQLSHVCVNKERMGLYISIEPLVQSFFERYLGHNNLALYEGDITGNGKRWQQLRSDFYPDGIKTYAYKKGDRQWEQSQAFSDLLSLIEQAGDQELLPHEEDLVEEIIDMPKTLRFFAAEQLLRHWDGYIWNNNNNFFYYDYSTKKIAFLPWGTDQTLNSAHLLSMSSARGNLFKLVLKSKKFRTQLWEEFQLMRDRFGILLPSLNEYVDEQMELMRPWFYGEEEQIAEERSRRLKKVLNDIANSKQKFDESWLK